ncbi:hypothetical protein, partial [Flavobacterium covae]|uniref:hypothetical protein n=1 Tax=Flavobacterium covae TaxID=2906076 RepID=UPI00339128FA
PKVLKIALKIKRGTQSKKHTLGFKGLHGIFSTFFSIPAQNRKQWRIIQEKGERITVLKTIQ